ncbi:hypothetical protein RRF57_009477 [Xylaria bambusicola]|uniref:Uncharacterized protein n=1 Tax=Xylaria bambusicola TaxID=326684 RepID=A0AAN7UQ11_9PEZI
MILDYRVVLDTNELLYKHILQLVIRQWSVQCVTAPEEHFVQGGNILLRKPHFEAGVIVELGRDIKGWDAIKRSLDFVPNCLHLGVARILNR